MTLQVRDRRAEPEQWARELGISRDAIELYAGADVIDLHVESFIWTRILGYNLAARNGTGLLDARFYSQVDLPRMLEAGLTGAVLSIATNPFRTRRGRVRALRRNVERLKAIVEAHPEQLALVKDHAGYVRARAAGRAACFVGLQGGNALDADLEELDRIPDDCVTRITLVHLTDSRLGSTSAPGAGTKGGLSELGRAYVRKLNERRILVDLAHASRPAFWDALEVHDRSQPAIVSHTGVSGVHDVWRNVDDRQLRAIAELGGVVGIIFHTGFLGEPFWSGKAEAIVRHMEHAIHVAGEDSVALGSDWDGLIVTPRDMKTVLDLPVLVQRMLDRSFAPGRIRKILGGNYLRVLRAIRPG